ncbi:Catenin delta-2 [Penaeus vannamei]|uniref:Catenin delta-2 n=1 Tax=Penaeus vannamei TaxID=6689 RepID=A0A423TP76_PENVA|nr:Catenin delta-2 [Penaeus vannamei]
MPQPISNTCATWIPPQTGRPRILGGIPPLVALLTHDLPELHRNACGALRNLSYGRQNDENKRAIRDASGIPSLVRLLRKTPDNEVKELVTGILWNLSSCEDLKHNIIDDALTVIVSHVIIPCSGWDGGDVERDPNVDVWWSTVFKNASGVLRNISSAGEYARTKLRQCNGLVDSLLTVIKSAIQGSSHDNKSVENCVCILRNLSYRCQEVEDPNYDKNQPPTQSRATATAKDGEGEGTDTCGRSSEPKDNLCDNLGCFGGSRKKKEAVGGAVKETSTGQRTTGPRTEPLRGMELLWQPEVGFQARVPSSAPPPQPSKDPRPHLAPLLRASRARVPVRLPAQPSKIPAPPSPPPQGFQGQAFQGSQPHLAPPPLPAHVAPPSPSLPHATATHSSSGPVVEHHHTHIHITDGAAAGPDVAHGTLFRPDAPAYREECECVHPSFCAAHDVVPRINDPRDISNLLDARSLHADILSNATDAEEDVTTTANPGEEEAEESRARRDTLDHLAPLDNSTDHPQGRALGFAPGLAGCDNGNVCCRNPRFNRPAPQRSSCGLRNAAGITGRVKNPEYVRGDTEFGEYPWHVAIMKISDDYVCGGALIDDVHVLTAAHCISGLLPQEMKIRLGDWDVFGPTEFYSHIEVGAESVVIHPDYYAGNLENDLAVVRMRQYVDFAANPHISPVCLPHTHTNFEGHRCYSTGWGKNAFGKDGKYQSILKEVDLPVVNRYQCQEALRHTRLGPNFFLRDGMMCAGGEQGKDTCKGDGGGPLVCEGRDGAFQLAGLVSWGIGCGHPGVPGVYVDVPFYLDWIHRITNAP